MAKARAATSDESHIRAPFARPAGAKRWLRAAEVTGRLRIVAGQPQRRDDGAHDRGIALLAVHLGQSGFAGSDRGLAGVADVTATRAASSKATTALPAE